VAAERKSQSLAELWALGKNYSAQLQFSGTGHNSDYGQRVSQETRGKLQSLDALVSLELPSLNSALVPLANSHHLPFVAAGKVLDPGKPRLDTDKLYLPEIYRKTFHGLNVLVCLPLDLLSRTKSRSSRSAATDKRAVSCEVESASFIALGRSAQSHGTDIMRALFSRTNIQGDR
jgi:hypothetical protein